MEYPLTHRPRRLRSTDNLRAMVRETHLRPEQLIYPIFIEEEISEKQAITTMPGQFRIPEKTMEAEVKKIAAMGVKHILLFGVSHHKDETGSDSLKKNGL